MHELSIAESLLDVARVHLPEHGNPTLLRVRVGRMRGIEPDAMQWAWQAARDGTRFEHAELQLELLDWQLRCPNCGKTWNADMLDATCPGCHGTGGQPIAGDELLLMSIEVDIPD